MTIRPEGRLRVIGGQWRSRLIDFDAANGVRPTPDRVRQTVFDWLAPLISGARCLDLFAGSGALGIEALSRGAASCRFVESDARSAALIRQALQKLKAEDAEVLQRDAFAAIPQLAAPFDVLFLDPPYGKGLLERALPLLPPLLSRHNRIYLEWPVRGAPDLPPGFALLRDKQAGQVCFGLATYQQPADAA